MRKFIIFTILISNVLIILNYTIFKRKNFNIHSDSEIKTLAKKINGTDQTFPYLVDYESKQVEKSVNDKIDLKINSICKKHLKVAAQIAYNIDPIISIRADIEWYCGGPYPVETDASMTFDLRTGIQIDFNALFKDYDENKEEILTRIFKEELNGDYNSEVRGCPFSIELLLSSTMTYTINPKYLEVRPLFIRACGWTSPLYTKQISYRYIDKYLSEQSVLKIIEKAL